jgi:site-specific DNA-methyltransferase (adenine-specific)
MHLVRKPLEATSVAANVLTHGTGALDIASTRVHFASDADEKEAKDKNQHDDFSSGPRDNRIYGDIKTDRADYDAPGRWPSNVILQHLPECQIVGTTTTRAKQLTAGRRTVRWGVGEGGDTYVKGTGATFATPDGTDTTPVWDCEPGCPVQHLNDEAGERSGGGTPPSRGKRSGVSIGGHGRYGTQAVVQEHVEHTLDRWKGTVSRFYQQVGGKGRG